VSDAEQKKRKKKGLCPTCCVRLEKISTITRKRTKVTNRAEGVVSGTCLKCKGITDGYNTRTGQPAAFFDNAADGERGGAGAGGGHAGRPVGVVGGYDGAGGAHNPGMMNQPVGHLGPGPGHLGDPGPGPGPVGQTLPPSGIQPPPEIEATPYRGVMPEDDNFTIISGLTMDQTMMLPNPVMYTIPGGTTPAAANLMPALDEDEESADDNGGGQQLPSGMVPGARLPLVDMTRNSSRDLMDMPGVSTMDLGALDGFDIQNIGSSDRTGSSPIVDRSRGSSPPPVGPMYDPILPGPRLGGRGGESDDGSGETNSNAGADSASSSGDSDIGFSPNVIVQKTARAAPDQMSSRSEQYSSSGTSENGGSRGSHGRDRNAASAEERGDDPSNFVSTNRFRSDENMSFPRIAEMQAQGRLGSQDLEGFDQDLSGFDSVCSNEDLADGYEQEHGSAYGSSRPPSSVSDQREVQHPGLAHGSTQLEDMDARKRLSQPHEGQGSMLQDDYRQTTGAYSSGNSKGSAECDLGTQGQQVSRDSAALEQRLSTASAQSTTSARSSRRFDVADEVPKASAHTANSQPPAQLSEPSRDRYAQDISGDMHNAAFTEEESMVAAALAADAAAAAMDPTGYYIAEASRWETLQSEDINARQWRQRQSDGRANGPAAVLTPTLHPPLQGAYHGRELGPADDCAGAVASAGPGARAAQLKRGDSLEEEAVANRELEERLMGLAVDNSGPASDPLQSHPDVVPLSSTGAASALDTRAGTMDQEQRRRGPRSVEKNDDASIDSLLEIERKGSSVGSFICPTDVRRSGTNTQRPSNPPSRMDVYHDAPSARSLDAEEEKLEIDDPSSFRASFDSPNCMVSSVKQEKGSTQNATKNSGPTLSQGEEHDSDRCEKVSTSSLSAPHQPDDLGADALAHSVTHASGSTDASESAGVASHGEDGSEADSSSQQEDFSSRGDSEKNSRRQNKPLVKDIPTILKCLEDYPDNPLVHERAYEALYELASLRDPRGKSKIIANGGIQATVDGIWRHMEVPTVQVSALYALWALSAADDNVSSKVALSPSNGDGVVYAILFSMRQHEHNAAVQLPGCGVLSCLASAASRSGDVDDGTTSGAMSTIMNAMQMHGQSIDVHEWGLRALYCECSNSDRNKIDFITANGETGSGIEILQRISDEFSSDLAIQEWVCRIFHCLSKDERAAERMVASDVPIKAVVAAMKVHGRRQEAVSLVEAACGMLGNLAAASPEIISSIRNEGGARAIVDAMNCFPSSAGVQASGCAALVDLSASVETRADILQIGGIDTVIASFKTFEGNHQIQEEACRVLCYLFVEAKAEEEDAPGNVAVSVAVEALRSHPEDEGIQEAACSLLGVLAADVSSHGAILSAGAIDQVARAMTHHSRQRTLQEQCCALFRNLSASSSNQDAILRSDVINEVIRSMIAHSDSEAVQENACCMFWNLASDSRTDPTMILDAGEIKYIIIAMQNFPMSANVQALACGALWSLVSTSDKMKEAVANCDGIEAILCSVLIHGEALEVLEKACGVFSSLSMDHRYARAIADNHEGIMSLIIESMRKNIASVVLAEYGCLMLRNLALSSTNYAEEASSACSTILKSMCEHPDASGLHREACGALWSLAASSETCKERILFSDGVKVITRTMQTFSSITEVQIEARGAMSQLVA